MRVIASVGIVAALALGGVHGHARAAQTAGQVALPGGGQGGSAVPLPGLRGPLPARDAARPTGTSRLRGRVVAADTGQPLRRATVRTMSPEIRESASTLTDADGMYEFRDLPAGRYTVTASKGSYATRAYGQTRSNEPGRPIALAANQLVERIDVRLPRGGVVTGVVTDEYGDPVPDATVTPLRLQFVQGRRRLLPAGRPATSNDIGGYRVFGLSPGTYYLSAVLRPQGGFQERTDVRAGYAPTYFPGTTDLASAQRLTVGVGQTVNDINLALVPTQTAQLSGTVHGPDGEPVRFGGVVAQMRGTAVAMFGGSTAVGPIGADGTFTIAGVPPGDYVLTSMQGPGGGPGAVSRATVAVNGADITGIRLVPSIPLTLTGRLIADGGTVTNLGGSPIQLMFMDPAGDEFGPGMLSTPPVTAKDDLTFEAQVYPGRVAIRLMGGNPRWLLKSVRVDGIDVTDSGIEVQPGSRLTDLEVEVTSQRQEITGVVTRSNGQPVANYTVVVFAQDRERWGPATRYISTARPDQDGRFRARALPGDFHVVAVEYVEPGGWMDPDFLDSVVPAAKSLSLAAGETKTIELTLVDPR